MTTKGVSFQLPRGGQFSPAVDSCGGSPPRPVSTTTTRASNPAEFKQRTARILVFGTVPVVIDDGPVFKLAIHRAVKKFEQDLQAWPRPPQRGGADWDSYWRWRFEDVLFRTGLGIRKLIESGKLSVEVQARPIEVRGASSSSGRVPDVLNLHRAPEFYDVESAQPTQVPLVKLCHAIVHSYVLFPTFTYSGASGLQLQNFLLASDRDRHKQAYVVGWQGFVNAVVAPVVTDDVTLLVSLRTGQGDELRIPVSTPELIQAGPRGAIEFYMSLSKENRRAVKDFATRYTEVWGRPPPDIPDQGDPVW